MGTVADIHFPAFAKLYTAGNPQNPSGKNFQDWNMADLRHLKDFDLGIIRGMAAQKDDGLDKFMPRMFFTGHTVGEAHADFERAILRESARRGNYEGFARLALQGRYGYLTQMPPEKINHIHVDTPFDTYRGINPDKSARHVKLSPTQAYTYDMASDIMATDLGASNIREDVVRAIAAANHGTLPDAVLKRLFAIHLGDEAGYDIGYTLRADPKFTNDLPTRIEVKDPKQLKALPAFIADAFDPHKTDGDLRAAIAAGWMQADIDAKHHFTSTDNKLFDFPPPPTPPGRGKVGVGAHHTPGSPG